MRLTLAGTAGVASRLAALTVKQAGGVAAGRQDRGMRDYTTVMADHPAWAPSPVHELVRAFPLGGGGYGIARTNGCQVRWCCPVGAADGPVPSVFMLPPSVPPDEPELGRALGALGPVARFRTPSLWDALGTAIIRQVVRAGHAQRLYRTFCESYGLPVSCGGWTVRLFPSPGTVLELDDVQFADAGLAFKRHALRAAAAAFLEHEQTWAGLPAGDLCAAVQQVPRIGPWTAGAAVADWTNDFTTYPYGDLAVRTWAARAAASRPWPADEQAFGRAWQRIAGPHLPELTLLVLAWGGRHARTIT